MSEITNSEESLGDFLVRIIAEQDGVKPEDITPAYIHEKREKEIYPNTRYEPGYPGLISLTRNEWDQLEKVSDELMSDIRRKKDAQKKD